MKILGLIIGSYLLGSISGSLLLGKFKIVNEPKIFSSVKSVLIFGGKGKYEAIYSSNYIFVLYIGSFVWKIKIIFFLEKMLKNLRKIKNKLLKSVIT